MKKKLLYETPSVETYDLVPNEQLLQASRFSNQGTETLDYDPEEDLI